MLVNFVTELGKVLDYNVPTHISIMVKKNKKRKLKKLFFPDANLTTVAVPEDKI